MKTLDNLKTTMDIDKHLKEIERLEQQMQDPKFRGSPDDTEELDAEYTKLEAAKDEFEDPITVFLKKIQNMTSKELGNLFASYVSDATHDANWEGFTPLDKTGIRKLLWDMMIAYDHRGEPDYYGDKYYYFTGSHYLLKDHKEADDKDSRAVSRMLRKERDE